VAVTEAVGDGDGGVTAGLEAANDAPHELAVRGAPHDAIVAADKAWGPWRSKTAKERLAAKLDNPGFTAKAPSEVVAKERARLAEISAQRDTLLAQLESLQGVS